MKVNSLKANPKNPRTATDAKLDQLKDALFEFGDMSGIVFNRTTRSLVGGHQRTKTFPTDAIVTVERTYKKPTRSGTVAEGFILIEGERFAYREVAWDKNREKVANLAANKHAGEWDLPQLAGWLDELKAFDVGINLDLTMFDFDERREFGTVEAGIDETVLVSEHERTTRVPKCKHGQLYRLGGSRLRVGREELDFCDQILAKFARVSGTDPILVTDADVKKEKPAKQAESRPAHG